MRTIKLLSLVLIAVFLFSSAGFCSDSSGVDDDAHCISCCSAGCHIAVLQEQGIVFFFPDLASYIPFNTALHQELFLRGIDRPPKAIL
jgi:hypothetical protein